MHKIASNIYSLPGGGVENGENYQMAVERECYEEAKAKVKFKSVVGILNYDVNMTCKSEKFLSTRIEYYCWCDSGNFCSFVILFRRFKVYIRRLVTKIHLFIPF